MMYWIYACIAASSSQPASYTVSVRTVGISPRTSSSTVRCLPAVVLQVCDSASSRLFADFHRRSHIASVVLCGINAYLEYLGKKEWQLAHVKLQQKPYLENVISQPDYEYLRDSLLKDGRKKWHFIVRFLAATGARISELLKIKVEHVRIGYLDINSKGGKTRRIYIPETLRKSALEWLEEAKIESGFIFLNRRGKVMTPTGLGSKLKKLGVKYGLDAQVVYPHSFRHRFAKNFIEKYNDIALLADLMGHSNIETTRIYLRRTHAEQREIVDTVITW